MITFILIQEKGLTESLLNWKTSTGPNSIYVLGAATEYYINLSVVLSSVY